MRPWLILASGAAATVAMTAIWHGPLGAGERLASRIEASARTTLDNYEMGAVEARLERRPLSRRLLLSGPADSFQRREIVRLLDGLPGVAQARWTSPQEPAR